MREVLIMKPVDEFISKKIEELRDTSQFQQFLETYNSWEENYQSLFKTGLIVGTIMLPLLVTLIFFLINNSNHNRLQIQEEIIEKASLVINQSNELNAISKSYIARSNYTEQMLGNLMRSSLNNASVDASKVKIANFDTVEEDGVNITSFDISFKDLSSNNVFAFLNNFIISKNLKIDEASITKNEKSNLLDGMITVYHYSKLQNRDE